MLLLQHLQSQLQIHLGVLVGRILLQDLPVRLDRFVELLLLEEGVAHVVERLRLQFLLLPGQGLLELLQRHFVVT